MVHPDTYTPDQKYYECLECGHRHTTTESPGTCPECDGRVRNIAVPRE